MTKSYLDCKPAKAVIWRLQPETTENYRQEALIPRQTRYRAPMMSNSGLSLSSLGCPTSNARKAGQRRYSQCCAESSIHHLALVTFHVIGVFQAPVGLQHRTEVNMTVLASLPFIDWECVIDLARDFLSCFKSRLSLFFDFVGLVFFLLDFGLSAGGQA